MKLIRNILLEGTPENPINPPAIHAMRLAFELIARLSQLSQKDRLEVLNVISEGFCMECGLEGTAPCTCWNDE